MKFTTIIVAFALCVALVRTSPVPKNEGLRSQALERLVMVEGDNEEALRSKRTIGVLRQLFPGISQIVEQKVSAITSEIIRILGPVILRGVLGNGGGGGGTGDSSSKTAGTTVELPIPDDDDDDDNNNNNNNNDNDSSSATQTKSRISISLPTYPPDEEDDVTEAPLTTSPTTSTTTTSTTTTTETSETTTTTSTTSTESSVQNRKRRKRHAEWQRSARDVNPEAENRVIQDAAESQNNEVRVQFADEQSNSGANEAVESELAPLEDIEVSDDENRNKRFLNFGFGASGGAGGAATSGSGGGSGNFLFDIIRQAADGAARAAGTVYRVVAGTQSLGLGLSATRDLGPAPAAGPAAPSAPAGAPAPSAPSAMPAAPAAGPAPGAGMQPPLVAGSGSSQATDVAAGAPSPGGRNDGTAEAVPGPVTRLFVIANRGISNLIQDLILRLAATSERIVNFKARLITSII